MQYLGIDWGTRRAAWCAIGPDGELTEGAISADEDGLVRLVTRLGPEVHGCIEMMSGAPWVRDSLAKCGWTIQIADARKVKGDRTVGLQDRPRRRARARRPRSPRPGPRALGALHR
jgi:hypothetical protein